MVYNYPRRPAFPLNYRPLIRQTVRSRTKDEDPKVEGRDLYVIEVREYREDPDDRGVPHVAIMDGRKLSDVKGNQKSLWIPVWLCEDILKYILKCKSSDTPPQYSVVDLEPCIFKCKHTDRQVELEVVGDSRRLRSFQKVPPKALSSENDNQEVIELRNELMPKLTQFLADVILRYRDVKSQMNVPSLYSPSGERRFFFDLRQTRYGKRLYISQVTDYHRNVIAVPLDTLMLFRERLNQAVDLLHLEDAPGAEVASSFKTAASTGTQQRSGSATGQRRRKRRSVRKDKRRAGSESAGSKNSGEKAGPTGDRASSEEEQEQSRSEVNDESTESEIQQGQEMLEKVTISA